MKYLSALLCLSVVAIVAAGNGNILTLIGVFCVVCAREKKKNEDSQGGLVQWIITKRHYPSFFKRHRIRTWHLSWCHQQQVLTKYQQFVVIFKHGQFYESS